MVSKTLHFIYYVQSLSGLKALLSKVVIIIIVIIAFKGTIQDFFTISSQRRKLSPACTLKWPGRNRVQITCKSRATHRALIMCTFPVTCHLVRRDSSAIRFDRVEIAHLVRRDSSAIKFDRVEIAFIWALFFLAEPLNRWRRGGNRSTRRKPLATSFRNWVTRTTTKQ